jgi:hypothetical protein
MTVPVEDGRPLLDELKKYIPNVPDVLALLLVKDGLKPAGWLEGGKPGLIPILDALGIPYQYGYGHYAHRLYFGRDAESLKAVIVADNFGKGDIGKALGYPPSAVKFFEGDRAEAMDRAEARFPYPEGKWFERKSPAEKHAYNEARTKAYDEELAPFEQYPNSVLFVYGKNDLVARAAEDKWKRHLMDKYGVKFQ